MVSLDLPFSFWRRRENIRASEPERIIPLPNIPGIDFEAAIEFTDQDLSRAREALRVLRLERQILGSAVTTIYESYAKGLVTQQERDRLLEPYKADLKRLEKDMSQHQRIVDLHDLEAEREQFIKNFTAKLASIDGRLRDLRAGRMVAVNAPTIAQNGGEHEPAGETRSEKPTQESEFTEAEKRVEKIREEILKAMDRLEQIESEG